ncbi:uncharacterized protein TNCV_1382431 [Trichonephila clavipes]|nr:uncharacterized protein TNCV_1382431 [Trichonephila clavipes]
MQASKKKQRGGIRILATEGAGDHEIYRRRNSVYDEYSACRSSVVEWRKIFLEGCKLLKDDARPRQAHCVITPWK